MEKNVEVAGEEYESPIMVELGEFTELTNGIGSQTWDTIWLWD
ncbi:lasso RiPP family leader peptide-containing protein [Streptomyces achromogenes]